MVQIHPFAALRPDPGLAPLVASVPYDVITAAGAADCIRGNPHSFLRVSRADAELPGVSPHSDAVYARARENLLSFVREGILHRDDSASLYLYQVKTNRGLVTGLVCTVDVDDYLGGTIRKHESTRKDKEEDRTRHIGAVNAQTGLVFLFYRDDAGISGEIAGLVPEGQGADASVAVEGGTVHEIFRIPDRETISRAIRLLNPIPCLYIADGHHRAASAARVALARRREGRGGGESDRFMAVLIPHRQVTIHGYSRLVTDLAGETPSSLLARVSGRFLVEPSDPGGLAGNRPGPATAGSSDPAPPLFSMYIGGSWYAVRRRGGTHGAGALPVLGTQVLQDEVLSPLLGIRDPRDDPRLQFLGGPDSLPRLQALVDRGDFAVAFAMEPIGIEEVMAVADAGGILPPKSTWFEPKLRSGLLIHPLD